MEVKTFSYKLKSSEIRIYLGELTNITDKLNPSENSELELIKNSNRKKEFITVRTLLRQAGINKNIRYSGRKPFLEENETHISISHCKTHAGIALCNKPCGLDIEIISDRVLKIRNKFLSEDEKNMTKNDQFRNNLFWSAKECLYKLNNELKDFKKDMQVIDFDENEKSLKILTPEGAIRVHFEIYLNIIICWCM